MTRGAWLALLFVSAVSFVGAADSARIFIYAQREAPTRSSLSVSCDGAVVARIKRGAYFVLDVTPGRHVLSFEKGVPLVIEVTAGDESFVRLDRHMEIGEPSALVFSKVHPAVAQKELRFLEYIDPKQARSPRVEKFDPRVPPEPRLKTRDGNP